LYGVRLAHRLREGARPVTVYVTTSLVESSAVAEAKEEMEYALELRRDLDDPPGELEWMRMRIPVDGTPTEFEVIAGKGDGWGAVAAVDDVVVSVEVRNFAMADVELESVTDVEPYLVAPQSR
jgi:hypothetical protein